MLNKKITRCGKVNSSKPFILNIDAMKWLTFEANCNLYIERPNSCFLSDLVEPSNGKPKTNLNNNNKYIFITKLNI